MTAPMPATASDQTGVAIAPTVALRMIARRFWPHARPYRKWIALSLLLVVIIPAIETAKIWMFKLVIDDVLVPKDFGPFVWIAAAFLALTVVGGAIAVLDDTLPAWIGERFVLAVRLDLFRHLHRISLVSLGRRKLGDVIARLTGDVAAPCVRYPVNSIPSPPCALLRRVGPAPAGDPSPQSQNAAPGSRHSPICSDVRPADAHCILDNGRCRSGGSPRNPDARQNVAKEVTRWTGSQPPRSASACSKPSRRPCACTAGGSGPSGRAPSWGCSRFNASDAREAATSPPGT
jgi:hypothetical protein